MIRTSPLSSPAGSDPPTLGELRKLGPEIHVLPSDTLLWRVYFRAGPYPSAWSTFRRFGPTDARFDHHGPPPAVHPTRAILYGADSGPTCLAEVFQTTRVIDRRYRVPHLAAFELGAPISLLDVTGAWVTRAGGNMAISSGSRVRSREWSRAIYGAYPKLQGIRYASSMNANQPAVALYERAQPALPVAPGLDLPLDHPGLAILISDAARRFGYRVV